jgi:hypothetical protein
VSSFDLMQLVQSKVSHAAGDQAGTLSLTFENGHVLKIYDDSEQYESYRINSRGQITIV